MFVAKKLGGKNMYVGRITGKLKVPINILKIELLYNPLNINNIPKYVANIENMKVTHLVTIRFVC